MDIRQILWDSACTIADHLAWTVAPAFDVPLDLEERFNGAALPHVARYYAGILGLGTLPETARILDMGCGYGRIAMELARQLGPRQQYFGLDPNAEEVEWAQRNISALRPNFSFERIDIHSRLYNPAGTLNGHDFRFPFEDGSLDLVCMISVLTHVDLPTVETYIREADRTLKPDTGRLVSTIFLLDDEVEALMADGQSRFMFPWSHGPSRVESRDTPELAIAHPRKTVLDMLESAGLAHVGVFNGHWSGRKASAMDFQDLLIADRRAGAVYEHSRTSSPPLGDDDVFPQAVYDRLRASAFGSREELLEFITWSASLTLNALWWQDMGLTLVLAHDERGETERLDPSLVRCRRLGIENPRPEDAPHDAQFHPVADAGIVALLVRAGVIAGRYDLLSCILEAAKNGFLVLDATRAGKRLVLLSPDASPRAAPIPAFKG